MAAVFFLLLAILSVAIGLPLVEGAGDQAIRPGIAVRQGEPKNVIAQKKSPFLLNCSVGHDSDLGSLSFKWRKDGKFLTLDTRVKLLTNGSLYFRRVIHKPRSNKSDEGLYDCLATLGNVGTIIARRVRVQVAGIDRVFTEEPQDQRVAVGGVARFRCQINAVPSPFYIWERNRTALPQNDNRLIILPSGILQITKVAESDVGQYRCHATQSFHLLPSMMDRIYEKFSAEARLDVYNDQDSRTASIVASSKNVTTTVGKTVTLECLVDGDYSNVTWTRQGKAKTLEDHRRMKRIGNNLRLVDVIEEDSGTYVCTVQSSRFPAISTSAILNVYEPPVITESSLSSRNPKALWVYLTCSADGNPKPRMNWYKDGEALKITFPFRIVNNQLVIVGGDTVHSGLYQCFMENEFGFAMTITRLEFYKKDHVPGTVKNVRAINVTKSEILLKWEGPDGPTVLAYSVVYSIGDDDAYDTVSKNNSIELKELPAFSNVSIKITAFSTMGAGPTSSPFVVQTKEDVPATPVPIMMEPKARAVLVTWQELPPKLRNGIITRYKINYRQSGTEDLNVVTVPGSDPSFLIEDLEPNTNYDIRMMAGTSVGFTFPNDNVPGSKWPWVQVRTLTKDVTLPPQIQVVPINATAVSITWNHAGSNPLRGYSLHVRNLQDGKNTTVIPLPSVARRYIIDNLEENQMYEITLVVEYQDGSNYSIGKEFHTSNAQLLPTPKNLRITLTTATSINLEWVQPASVQEITLYTVRYSEYIGAQGAGELKFRTSDTTEILLEDLKPGTEYQMSVRAHTEKINSQYSAPLIQATTEVASEPLNLKAGRTPAGIVSLVWSPPSMVNGKITSYMILYTSDQKLPDDAWSRMKVTGDETTAVFPGLKGKQYYFKIQAITEEGPGLFSLPIKIDLEAPPTSGSNKDQKLGIIIGVSIGVFCIIVCVLIIVLRMRFYSTPYNQPAETQPARFHGNGHIPNHRNGHAVAMGENRNSADLYEMNAYTPMLTHLPENEHSDSKGGGNGNVILTPNGAKLNGFVPLKKNGVKNGQVPNGHMTGYLPNHYKEGLLDPEETSGLIAAMLNSTDGGAQCMSGQVAEESFTRSRVEDLAGSLDDIDRSTEDMSADHRNTGIIGRGNSVSSGSDRNSDIDPVYRYSGGDSMPRSDTTDTGDTVVLRAGFGGGGDANCSHGSRPQSSVSGGECDRCMKSVSLGDASGGDGNYGGGNHGTNGDESAVVTNNVEAESSAVLPQIQPCTTSCHPQALRSVSDTTGESAMATGSHEPPLSSGQQGEPQTGRDVPTSSSQGNIRVSSSVPQSLPPLEPVLAHTLQVEEIQFSQLPQDKTRSSPRRRQDYV